MNKDTITIVIRFFASAKDLAGTSETKMQLPLGSVAGDALDYAFSQYPELKKLKSFTRLAVNETYADLALVLVDGDEVAIIPPVSGG